MKKTYSLLFICLLLMSFVIPAGATEFSNPPVTDGAGYLSESELSELSDKLNEIRNKYDFEVAIVTEKEMSGYDAEASADDIYDYRGYGAGENDDGILLYICSDERKYHLSTFADGLRVFNENGIDYLKMNIEPHLSEDEYYLAMNTFADLADELLLMAANGEPFTELPNTPEYVIFIIALALVIPLIIAFIAMGIKLAQMKTAVSNDYAADYIRPGSKNITASRDIFLYSHITKTEKPKNNTSGSHTSSSGRTHGGGGGSF